MSELVKLYLYQLDTHSPQTIINIVEANTWNDFLFVKVPPASEDTINIMIEEIQSHHPNVKIIAFDADSEIELYGVKDEVEDES